MCNIGHAGNQTVIYSGSMRPCAFLSVLVFLTPAVHAYVELTRGWGFTGFFFCCMLAKCFSWICRLKNLSSGLLCVMSVCVCACLIIVTIFFPIYTAYVSLLSSLIPPATLSICLTVRTGYLQLWIQSTAPFSLAPHMETLRTWPLQVRLTRTCTFIILCTTEIMFSRMAASDKQHFHSLQWRREREFC